MARGPKKKEPGPGHNSQFSDEQLQAYFLNTVNNIADLDNKIASLTGKRRQIYAEAKTFGISKKDINDGLSGNKDPDILLKRRQQEERVLRWLGLPVGTQGELPVDPPLVDRAFDEGKRAGMGGKPCDPVYDAASEAGQSWIKGWHEGNTMAQQIKSMKPEDGGQTLHRQETHKPENDEFEGDLDDDSGAEEVDSDESEFDEGPAAA